MSIPLFERLHREGLISHVSFEKLKIEADSRLFSVHWELRTLLYAGVLLLSTGLGILIYKNIDTIGHQAILAMIALLCAGCFIYCERKKLPYSNSRVAAPGVFFDYVLLLGCLTLITFITYLQVQYTAFGNAYGLAVFLPMVVLFFCAYYFDHLGVLSMAITNFAAWAGIAVTPLTVLRSNDFNDARIIFTALALGTLLTVLAAFSERKKIKAHFSFTYMNFGMNIFFIAGLAGMFYFEHSYAAWLLPLAGAAYYYYHKAVSISSFYFMLMLTAYGYTTVSYVLIRGLLENFPEAFMLVLLYLMASGAAAVAFLVITNKKLRRHDSIR